MRRAQLDQNLTSRKLIEACTAVGKVNVLPLPNSLKGLLDKDLLPILIAKGALIVTNDVEIVRENIAVVPNAHPGVLIVDQDDDELQTMTWKISLKIILGFQAEFPKWDEVPWENSVMHLKPSHIDVQYVNFGQLHRAAFVDRSNTGWQHEIESALVANSRRSMLA